MVIQYQQSLTEYIHPMLFSESKEELLFFDIETTGFSSEKEEIYLIGCIYYKENSWELRQFFSDKKESEVDLLRSFLDLASNYHSLIHYNGESFDIPFLKKRAEKLGLSVTLPSHSIDLYKEVRSLQSLLNLKSLKQKEVERDMGLSRKDTFDGKQLIGIYFHYQKSREERLLSFLLLHNADDLRGMLTIVKLRSLFLLREGHFQIQKTICQDFWISSEKERLFVSRLLPDVPLPVSFYDENKNFTVATLQDGNVQIKVSVYKGSLKYFYPNYKEYYYLPEEDYAIHKSIASYVDSAHRIKAKASTCYIKKEGCFFMQPKSLFTPEFKQDYTDPYSFFEVSEDFFHSVEQMKQYLTSLLSYSMSTPHHLKAMGSRT